jgi:hypothetical protein
MAAKKQPKSDDIDDDMIDAHLEFEDEEADEAFGRVLLELSGGDVTDAKVHIYRDIKGKSTGAELFSMSPDEFSMGDICDRLREDYNGGEFRAVLKRAGRICKSTPIIVEVPKSRNAPIMAHGKDESMDKFLLMMQQQNEQSRQAAADARQEARESQRATNALMLEMVKSKSNTAQDPMAMLNLIISAQKLNGGGGGDNGIESLMQGIALGKELSGGDGESPLISALKSIAPVISQGIAMQAASNATAKQAPLAQKIKPLLKQNPVATPVTPAPVVEKADTSEFEALGKMCKRAADKNSDPALYADLLLDQMGDAVIEAFTSDMQYEAFVMFIPGGITPTQKIWLDELREMVLTSEITDEADEDLSDGEAISDTGSGENTDESTYPTA